MLMHEILGCLISMCFNKLYIGKGYLPAVLQASYPEFQAAIKSLSVMQRGELNNYENVFFSSFALVVPFKIQCIIFFQYKEYSPTSYKNLDLQLYRKEKI